MTPVEFTDVHLAALERNEARHNKILTVFGYMASRGSSPVATWTLGAPGACAIQEAGKPILLGDLSEDECRALADQTKDISYAGVVGPDITALWFAERAHDLGRTFLEPVPQRIHSLRRRPTYPGARGICRLSTPADAGFLADWIGAFFREAVPFETAPSMDRLLTAASVGRHFLWIVDGEPVSTAAIVRRTRNAAAISLVYTPPPFRGNGYAGSVTAGTVEHAFMGGKTIACLYTDRRNPIANHCYAKIGFETVCDAAHVPTTGRNG